MHHLREVDGERHTVLMVQVENEVGVIPQSRDHSEVANSCVRGRGAADVDELSRETSGFAEPRVSRSMGRGWREDRAALGRRFLERLR